MIGKSGIRNNCDRAIDWCPSLLTMWCNLLTCNPLLSKLNYPYYNCDGIKAGDPMPQYMVDLLLLPLIALNANPSGIWADFHCAHLRWERIVGLSRKGYIPCLQVPSLPNPSNYPDNFYPATQSFCGCVEKCCRCGDCQVPITGSTRFFRP